MIEIVCKDKLQQEEGKICLPKNIRQIGSPRGRHKIYIEDYVYTYIKSTAQKKESCAVIFLGKGQVMKDIRYTFISGAIECGPGVFQWDSICLDDSFWQYIEEEKKQYFPEKEIVGWFLGKTGQAMELTSVVEAAHRKYFSGRDKILMLMDVLEEEEVFFIYDQGYLQKREGYYIYYEKNLSMQEYMIQKRGEVSSEDKQWPEEMMQVEKAAQRKETLQEKVTQGKETLQEEAAQRKEIIQEEAVQKRENLQEEAGQGKEALQKKSVQRKANLQKEEAAQLEEILQPEELVQAEAEDRQQREAESDGQTALETMESKERQAKFRELHKELEREIDTGNQEKIFAKSNLEEPKTQAEEALESYRNMILERQGRQIERQNRKFLYTASSFFLVVVCVLGITTINNYRKMQEVEDVLHVMNSKESQEKRSEGEEGPVVESVMSQVDPLEETKDAPSSAEAGQSGGAGEAGKQEAAEQTAETSGETGQGTSQPQESAGGTDQSEAGAGETSQETNQPKEGSGQTAGVTGEMGQAADKPKETAEEDNSSEESAEASAAQPQEARYYIVKSGDTLGSICISVYHDQRMMAKVCEANGIENGDKIYVGQRLLLP